MAITELEESSLHAIGHVVAKSGTRRKRHPTPTRSTDLERERRQFRSPFHSISNLVNNLLNLIVYKGGNLVHEELTSYILPSTIGQLS